MVGWEKRRLLVLRWKAGTFAFNQVLYEAVVAAVAFQGRPAGAFKELRIRCPLEAEQSVAGLVESLGRDSRVLCEDTSSDAIYGRRSLRSWNLPSLYAGLPLVSTRSISGSSMARSAGMGIPQDSARVMYLLTVPLYRSSLRPIDRFDSPSRWRRNACLILFISLHLLAMACSIYG